MGYTTDASMVRVDFFKPSGKWYDAEAVEWLVYEGDIHEAFRTALDLTMEGRLKGMTAVCLRPNHKYAHPISLVY